MAITYSEMQITFNEDLVVGSSLSFEMEDTSSVFGTCLENWVLLRNGVNKVTTGTPTVNPGERAAINFLSALQLDYNSYGFVTHRSVNVITIKATDPTHSFGNPQCLLNNAPTVADVDFVIDNYTLSGFDIDSVDFSAATVPCTHVSMTVQTSDLAVKIISPVSIDPNADNPFSIEIPRGIDVTLTVEDATGNQVSELVVVPALLNAANFNLLINNSPNGATVVISNTNSDGLDLEYSLDNSTWQTSSNFSGLPAEDYILYVRDQLGCSFQKTFTIDEFGINTPYFSISKSNSLRLANRITWGDSANYKTDENTLSCEADVKLPYKEIQQFQSADIITTQFKSNYNTNTATIVKEDLTEVDVPVTKMTNNIGIKDKRDARKYDLGNGKTGIYFLSGNIYDYVTNTVVEPYALNGLLPEWAQSGNYFQIAGTWYLIEDVIFDEAKNADVIVFSNTYTSVDVGVIVGSIFNRFNYEVYEFTIDMNGYIDQKFRVRINNDDTTFGSLVHLSELIWCKVKHENVLEIRYRNTTNTDVFYSTGIQHLIRIPYLKVKGKDEANSETHKTDTTAILLNADIYESEEFVFEPVTKEIWRKMKQALSHEIVAINGVGYVKNGDFNTEGPLEDTNLYVLTATMIKTGSVYNSQTSGNLDFDGTSVAVPGLISTDSGYVSY